MWKCKKCGGEIIATIEVHEDFDFSLDKYGNPLWLWRYRTNYKTQEEYSWNVLWRLWYWNWRIGRRSSLGGLKKAPKGWGYYLFLYHHQTKMKKAIAIPPLIESVLT